MMNYLVNLSKVNQANIDIVGGKNASTGEMIQHLSSNGVNVPGGYATTVEAYRQFLAQDGLDKRIIRTLSSLKSDNFSSLNKASSDIRKWILQTPFFSDFEKEISIVYSQMKNGSVAVRSSATVEDLALASFAGAQETFLNVKGLNKVLRSIKLVYASLYTSRAIAYRYHQGFNHDNAALSVGIQPMIRSDKGASGVMFTLDTESGFDKVILISAAYGLGESIVQGKVNPDEFIVSKTLLEQNKPAILQKTLGDKAVKMIYKDRTSKSHQFIKEAPVKIDEQYVFCITDKDILDLARQAIKIEKHYGKPMDIEWAKDGITGELYIVQARPETVSGRDKTHLELEHYQLSKPGKVLAEGSSVGQRIGCGAARVIMNVKDGHMIRPGDILVTDMTDPDWEPVMKKVAAIVTNRGGRTCHAAIIARELGIPAVVGCGNATTRIKKNEMVTVSCAEGQIGHVYAGKIPYKADKISIKNLPKLPLDICINIGNPEKAFATCLLPNAGVGLARLEFIISGIGIHPNALLQFSKLPKKLQQEITKRTAAYKNPVEFYIEKLREGISTIAAAFYPKPVIFRFSDFKSNEYANLLGGHLFEPTEENPMIGFRGASRYKDKRFSKCFELECLAFKRVRDEMGLTNAHLMVPFVRTVTELRDVIALIESFGLKRGRKDLKLYMMCEIPSNILLAKQFLQHVDGFSIGSNDLTQLTLGIDRDSNIVAGLFDERDEAVKKLLHEVIAECNKLGKYIGICGQGPSDHPDFAKWLMKEGIKAISVNPDTVIKTWLTLAKD